MYGLFINLAYGLMLHGRPERAQGNTHHA